MMLKNNYIDKVLYNNKLFAIIIRASFVKPGIDFFTPNDFSQQLAYMNRPSGYKIPSHIHNKVLREVFYTQEVLFIKRGKVEVTFFNDEREPVETRIIETGDVILLAGGGHGFEMLEDTEMIEVKQGPYAGEGDKTRF